MSGFGSLYTPLIGRVTPYMSITVFLLRPTLRPISGYDSPSLCMSTRSAFLSDGAVLPGAPASFAVT